MKCILAFVFGILLITNVHAAEIKILSVIKTGVTAYEIKHSKNKLYVAAGSKGIFEIDLYKKNLSSLISNAQGDDYVEAVEIFDNKIAYVVNGELIIRNIDGLELVKQMNLDVDFHAYTHGNDMFHSIQANQNKLYVSTKFYGLIEVTLNNSQIRNLETKYATKSVDFSGSTLVSADNCGLSFVNPVSGSFEFIELNGCDYRSVKVVGTKAVVGSCRGLTIVDLATRSVVEQMIEMPACVGGIDYDPNSNLFYMTMSGGGKAPYSQGVVATVLIKNL